MVFHKEENDRIIVDEGRVEQTHDLWATRKSLGVANARRLTDCVRAFC